MSDTTDPPTKRRNAPGAGRPRTLPAGVTDWHAMVTAEERAQLQVHLARIRSNAAQPWRYLVAGMDAAERHRPAEGAVYLSLSDGGAWQASAAPWAEEVQLRVPSIGPVELFDDRSV